MPYCINCGTELKEDDNFCLNCGAERTEETTAEPLPVDNPTDKAPNEDTAPLITPPVEPKAPKQPVKPLVNPKTAVLSVGSYIGMFILLCIPVIGFIITLIWACGGCKNKNRSNFAKAVLILWLVCLIVLFFGFIFTYAVFHTEIDAFINNIDDFFKHISDYFKYLI